MIRLIRSFRPTRLIQLICSILHVLPDWADSLDLVFSIDFTYSYDFAFSIDSA